MRRLTDMDKQILNKLAPELEGATVCAGHDYKFILLPVSHKLSESLKTLRTGLTVDRWWTCLPDRSYYARWGGCALPGRRDYDALLEMIEKRLPEKAKELKERWSAHRYLSIRQFHAEFLDICKFLSITSFTSFSTLAIVPLSMMTCAAAILGWSIGSPIWLNSHTYTSLMSGTLT